MSDDNSRSPYEQGELQSSPSPEFVRTKYKKERQFSLSPKRVETIDDIIVVDRDSEDDTLDIKPPQTQSGKRERSHKHKHKDDKRRDRDRRERDHGRERDRVRSVHVEKHRLRQDRGNDRQIDRHPDRQDRGHREKRDHRDRDINRDKHRDRQVERIVVERVVEKERIVITETREERETRESKKREQSLMERDRLEEKEREKQKDLIRQTREEKQRKIEEREKRKNEEREKKKLEEKRAQAARQAREKSRPEKRHRSRSRDSHRKSQPDKREDRKQYGEPAEKTRKRGPRTPEEPKDEVIEVDPPSSEHEAEVIQSESDVATESESDSESDSSSESSHEEEEEEESGASNKDEDQDDKHDSVHNTGKVKSKFDEHSENESEHGNVSEDENQAYIADSPPPSPIEEEIKLPPYLPAIQGCRSVEEFRCLNRIEEGTYGVVYRAMDKKNDEIVALKRLKMEKEKEGFPITSLREINTLLKAQHPNIVTVREIVVGSNMDKIYIVMDYVEHDLKSLMEVMKSPFSIGETKTLLKQLLRAVNHLHDNWILHRDLKTSNLLFSHKGILKVGDFGLAREYGSPLRQYTPIVVTLWYRAPELLLGCKQYSTAIDMWSVGCIFAEFLTMKPLWPGKSEIDELNRIFKDMGTPNEKIWPGVSDLPGMKKCSFTEYPYNTIRNRFGTYLSDLGADLLNRFLAYSPSRRINAEEGLNHTYFTESPVPVDPSMFPTWPAKSEQSARKHVSSPKPPSGGKAYSRLVSEEDSLGFHMSTAAKGAASGNLGFTLKF